MILHNVLQKISFEIQTHVRRQHFYSTNSNKFNDYLRLSRKLN